MKAEQYRDIFLREIKGETKDPDEVMKAIFVVFRALFRQMASIVERRGGRVTDVEAGRLFLETEEIWKEFIEFPEIQRYGIRPTDFRFIAANHQQGGNHVAIWLRAVGEKVPELPEK